MTDGLDRPETIPAAITPAQHRAAKVVGFLYLIQMALAVFGESFVRGRLIVRDAGQTAANIAGSERLFRLSLAGDLMIYASVVVLFWGIYIILKPVNKDVALLGAFFRLIEQAILAVTIFFGFIALRLLSGPEYLRVVDTGATPGAGAFVPQRLRDRTQHRLRLSRIRLGGLQLCLAAIALHSEGSGGVGNFCVACPRHCQSRHHDLPSCLCGARNELHDADGYLRNRPGLLASV